MINNNKIVTSQKRVQLEIDLDKLALLFESGLICAAEMRCLNVASKQHVSDLCLRSCAKKMACNISFFNESLTTQTINIKTNFSSEINNENLAKKGVLKRQGK